MNVREINDLLSRGDIDHEELWPHLLDLKKQAVTFNFEFGLKKLPIEPGLIIIRGPRQYGKSTWLELHLKQTIQSFKKGSAYYINGDEISTHEDFFEELIILNNAFSKDVPVKRIFIDEVTAIIDWEKALKRAWDQGFLRDVLIITTGSKARDLRRGIEKLPGRKGKLPKNEYIFLPISYKEFHTSCSHKLKSKTLVSYLLTGGSPIVCNEMYSHERIPEYCIQLIRDWILGEIVSSGRSRISLHNVFNVIFKYGGQAVGYAKLAREAGLANNTVASGYIEQLVDLLSLLPSWQWDQNTKNLQIRKPCKFNFINLAAAIAFHPSTIRTVHEFETLPDTLQALFLEWIVAQEIWRRSILADSSTPESLGFWKSDEHEIDFITPQETFIEVKKGKAGPLDFLWFNKVFPKKKLLVICKTPFETNQITGITLEDFLVDETIV